MSLARWPVALLAVLVLVSSAGSQGSSSRAHLDGPVAGIVDLPPAGSSAVGSLSGALLSADGSLELYRFQALLMDVPSPCLSCGEGDIRGTLDDGVGVGPDFIVVGHYRGSFFGTGHYAARIYRPGGTTPIGIVQGRYADPIGSSGPGGFAGRFRILR